jgi:hypothetical protein
MMFGWRQIAFVLFSASVCAAQTPTTRPVSSATQPSAEVVALVNDLTSDDFATRQSAQKKIEQLGPSVEPELHEVLQGHLTDEARARIESALQHIQENHDFGPSVITLHYENAPLATVLDDFADQAGADLGVHRPEFREWIKSRTVSIDLDRADFWTTLRKLEDLTGLHVRPADGDGRMILDRNGGWFDIWDSDDGGKVAGPCIIFPKMANSTLQYGRRGNNSYAFNLTLQALIEPKLHVVGESSPNWLRECVDDKGHSLLPPGAQPNFFPMNSQRWWMQLMTNLQPVHDMGTRIARLRGELDFDIQTQSEVVEVDQLSSVHDLVKTAGGNTITIERFSSENGQYQLHLTIRGSAASAGWGLVQNLLPTLQILDDKDRPLQTTSTSTNMTGNGQMNLVLGYNANFFPNIGPPTKLRWEITTETRQLKVPFELDDFELSQRQ